MLSSKTRTLRRTMTLAEQRLWSILRNRQLAGNKFRRQYPFDTYVLDFACAEAKLCVEADGGQHAESVRDDTRTALLAAHGWRMLRFWNNEILGNTEGVAAAILEALDNPLPQGGRGAYAAVLAELAGHGLLARGGFENKILVGTAGSAFWPHFQAARRDEPHPLDSWTRRVLTEIAERFGARVLMPGDGPPFHPFQRWAMAAEPVFPSPMGVLVHPEYGLWHAYRGALQFDQPVIAPPREDAANPCEGCPRPCVAACPVNAAAPYDVPGCMAHLKSGGECRSMGCLSRHACPLGQAYAYSPEHARFHMDAFVTAEWCS